MINVELLKELCAVYGPTGSEDLIGNRILNEIKDYIDDYSFDSLGSLIAHKKGTGKKMMLAGHMDQIGLIATYIDENGFIRFAGVGGLSPYATLYQRVIFRNGTVGVIGCERLDDMRKDFSLEKLYIDIGAKNRDDAAAKVKIGDVCVYLAEPLVDDTKIITPALDDRIGCFIMIEALKRLKNPVFDLYLVFTVQEEIGMRGAKTSAYTVDPDFGISFDVTISSDTPNAKKLPSKMGDGAAIKLKDASLICHPLITKHLEKCAVEAGIKHQYEILEEGGSDSGAIHINKSGVPSGVISVATRYVHSSGEMARLSDIEDCVNLTVCAMEKEIAL